MKVIFLDFDRTIFNTDLFYSSLEQNYVFGQGEHQIEADLNQFIYDDVVDFLCLCQKNDIACVLLTFGNRLIQEFKFRATGIESYFKDMLYVERGSKAECIKKYLETYVSCEKVIFIDDTIEHLEGFVESIPAGRAVRMVRLGAKGSEIKDNHFEAIENFSNFHFNTSNQSE